MPDQRSRQVARSTQSRTASDQLRTRRLYDPPPVIVAGPANKKVVYDLLFHASDATLLEVAADPKHLGAEIGFLNVHTWGQNLQQNPHS